MLLWYQLHVLMDKDSDEIIQTMCVCWGMGGNIYWCRWRWCSTIKHPRVVVWKICVQVNEDHSSLEIERWTLRPQLLNPWYQVDITRKKWRKHKKKGLLVAINSRKVSKERNVAWCCYESGWKDKLNQGQCWHLNPMLCLDDIELMIGLSSPLGFLGRRTLKAYTLHSYIDTPVGLNFMRDLVFKEADFSSLCYD